MTSSPDANRRRFLKSSGVATAGASWMAVVATPATAAAPACSKPAETGPVQRVARLGSLKVGQAAVFHYPDANSPCLLIRLGAPTDGGIGPQQDVVAFSQLCTHMGCPVSFEPGTRVLQCPCHFTTFDAERRGQMVCGQASTDLPRIELRFDAATEMISAVGVQGRIFGRI